MTLGIISNIAALSAQANLAQAALESQSSIYRLSSGNAIMHASDDVAGLAIGSMLHSDISSLKSALNNASQASSMLSIADSAIRNINNILTAQQVLATQATSGALSSQDLVVLNNQFQNLTAEVESIASGTNFNKINLLDGSLYAPSTLGSNSSASATHASGTITLGAALVTTKHVFINGASIVFNASATIGALPTDQRAMAVDITANTTPATQADALYAAIQYSLGYNGTDSTVLANKAKLSQLSFTHTTGTAIIGVSALASGAVGNGSASGQAFCAGSDSATATDVLVNGGNAAALTISTSIGIGYSAAGYSPVSVGANGDLNAGTFSSGPTAYNGTASVVAQGAVNDSLLKSLNTTTQASSGVDVSLVSNNSSFVGNIISNGASFSATYVSANVINAQITVGSSTYTANNINTNFAAGTLLTFASSNGGSFTLQTAANNVTVASQSDASLIATRLNSAFSGLSFYNNRTVNSYAAAGTMYGTSGGAATGDLAGSSLKFISNNFSNMQVQSVSVQAPAAGASNATISLVINGNTYMSGYNQYGTVTALGSTVTAGTTIGLVNQNNANQMLVFSYTGGGAATTLDLSSTANALAAQNALIAAFGVNQGATKAVFQVGSKSSNTINLQIQSAQPNAIYLDNNGIAQNTSMNLLSSSAATAASKVVGNAIQNVSLILATIGSLESNFNYASSNINSAIQNQEAARAVFLDTDFSAESTKFAQSQVRSQAAISVLAQANQLPQNLLKLLG